MLDAKTIRMYLAQSYEIAEADVENKDKDELARLTTLQIPLAIDAAIKAMKAGDAEVAYYLLRVAVQTAQTAAACISGDSNPERFTINGSQEGIVEKLTEEMATRIVRIVMGGAE